jgi:hypothetical protein
MKRLLTLAAAVAFTVNGCADGTNSADSPSPTRLELAAGALNGAALTGTDVGGGWDKDSGAVPSTIQIGGKVGAANVKGAEQEVTSAFKQKDGSGYVSNSVFLVESAALAESVIAAHREATAERWTQERKDGGGTDFRRTGQLSDLPALGDEMFTATVNATVRQANGTETKRKIEYVVYRIDRLLAFVIAQDVGVGKYVRAQEQRVARVVA